MAWNKVGWAKYFARKEDNTEINKREQGDRSAGNVKLLYKVIEIGDWNMDTTSGVSVAHGLGDLWKNIRSISVIIRRDADDYYFSLMCMTDATNVDGAIDNVDSTNISLQRRTGGEFDGANYDSTSYNRGWITIWYTP